MAKVDGPPTEHLADMTKALSENKPEEPSEEVMLALNERCIEATYSLTKDLMCALLRSRDNTKPFSSEQLVDQFGKLKQKMFIAYRRDLMQVHGMLKDPPKQEKETKPNVTSDLP